MSPAHAATGRSLVPAWALSPQAVEAIRAQMLAGLWGAS